MRCTVAERPVGTAGGVARACAERHSGVAKGLRDCETSCGGLASAAWPIVQPRVDMDAAALHVCGCGTRGAAVPGLRLRGRVGSEVMTLVRCAPVTTCTHRTALRQALEPCTHRCAPGIQGVTFCIEPRSSLSTALGADADRWGG